MTVEPVDVLAEALAAIWPHHWEGTGSLPPSPSDYQVRVPDPGMPHAHTLLAALLALPPDRRAAIAAELLDVETLAPHPNEQHEFRTTCLRCGERGMLNISLIGPDEVVTVAAIRGPQ